MTDKTTCRYCPFYVPEFTTPIMGHCSAIVPPRFINLPYDGCPYDNDRETIERIARNKDFDNHVLRALYYAGWNKDGIRTPYNDSLTDLKKKHPEASDICVFYMDSRRHIFYRVRVPETGEGVLS